MTISYHSGRQATPPRHWLPDWNKRFAEITIHDQKVMNLQAYHCIQIWRNASCYEKHPNPTLKRFTTMNRPNSLNYQALSSQVSPTMPLKVCNDDKKSPQTTYFVTSNTEDGLLWTFLADLKKSPCTIAKSYDYTIVGKWCQRTVAGSSARTLKQLWKADKEHPLTWCIRTDVKLRHHQTPAGGELQKKLKQSHRVSRLP